jgi:Na+-translocating ferredoxin:NAD+ oxidoreductase RnfC subunit
MPQKLSKDHIYSESKGKVKGNYRLDEDHLLPSKLQRYKRGESFAERARSTLFNQVDDVLDEVYCDICNGVARSDIVQKLMKTQYESQSGQQKNMTYRTANEYYNCALDRMHFNTDIEHARLKDIFYNRYESLLETAIKKGDVFNAKGVLDSMAKIFLGMDKQQNNIQINNNKDGITIHFGFTKDEDNEDKEEEQEYEEINEG